MPEIQPPIPTVTVTRSDEGDDKGTRNIVTMNPDGLSRDVDYENLCELMTKCAIPHADYPEVFWPEQLLRRILTRVRVVDSLERCNLQHLVDQILDRYLKIFAILVLIEEEDQIGVFVEENVSDQDLPLVESSMDHWKHYLARDTAPEEALKYLCPGRASCREMFLLKQYRVLVAYLDFGPDGRATHVDFSPQTVMPWRSHRHKENGGYACVFQIDVEPTCHGFRDALRWIKTGNSFALKELTSQKRDLDVKVMRDFQNEVDMLRRFSGYPHLVTLLMTWTWKGHHYLLFPCADCDLDRYWSHEPNWGFINTSNAIEPETVAWISKQVQGMADALDVLHNPRHLLGVQKYGRHGDIKPENILWYPSSSEPKGVLVIADFGLSAFNSENSRSNIPNQNVPQTPGYRPPECDLKGGRISRAFDVWTMGALLLELTCWVLGGPTLRGQFETERMLPYITGSQSNIFFDVKTMSDGEGHAILVKEKVTEMIAKLHGKDACTDYFHDLLDLIEGEMLIVRSAQKDRISSRELLIKITGMHTKVVDPFDRDYGHTPHPEARKPKQCVTFDAVLNNTALGLVQKHGEEKLSTHTGPTERSATVHRV